MSDGFSIHFEGIKEFAAGIDKLVARMDTASRIAVTKGGNLVKKNIQGQLSIDSHRRDERTASAPGTPPSLVSGALRRSISVQLELGTDAKATIGPTIIYGRIQELGGTTGYGHHSRLPSRPYVRPGLMESMPELINIYHEAWSSGMRL